MNLEQQVLKDLRRHEGCRLSPYLDTENIWTIGYGRIKGIHKDYAPITQEQADAWLYEDYLIALRLAKKIVKSYAKLSPERKSVVINMAFNLGNRLAGFEKTLAAIEQEQWATAALEMLNSKWSRQVGQRAKELANRMSSGVIQPHHRFKGD